MTDIFDQLLQFLELDVSDVVVAFSAATFVFVTLITLSVARTVSRRGEIRERALHVDACEKQDVLHDRRTLGHEKASGSKRLLSSVASNFVPGDEQSVSAVRSNLMNAGFFQPTAVAWYYLIRVVLALGLPSIAYAVVWFGEHDVSTTTLGIILVGSGALGLLFPSVFLSRVTKRLQRQSREGFPDFMDLLVVCTESGISLEAAISRVSGELAQNYPFFGVCLHMASLELRAGRPLIETFHNLAERLGIEEAKNLGSLLQQSKELGTSLAHALRVYSDEMRDKRMSAAEEKAHALPAKMTIPLTVFVFPVILIVIMLPVAMTFSLTM